MMENVLFNQDGIEGLSIIPDKHIHLILSDIPYGIGTDDWDVLHNNKNSAYLGSSPAQKKSGAIFKKRGKPINGWSEDDRNISIEYYNWCNSWTSKWFRILKQGGSVFVFAGRRYAHRCISAMEDSGFNFKDMLTWIRPKAPHRAQRLSAIYERRNDTVNANLWKGWKVGNLRPIAEPILWFTKPYKIGTTIADNVIGNHVGAFNEEAFLKYQTSPDNILSSNYSSKETGLHPTQKPIVLMKTLIELTTKEGQIVLDPFCGSGTTLLAAKELNRKYIGFELDDDYYGIAKKRIQ